jgi:hypothetical protein
MSSPADENHGSAGPDNLGDIIPSIRRFDHELSRLTEMTLGAAFGEAYFQMARDERMADEHLSHANPRLRELAIHVISCRKTISDNLQNIIMNICDSDPDIRVRTTAIYGISRVYTVSKNQSILSCLARLALEQTENESIRKAAYKGVILARRRPGTARSNIDILLGDADVASFDTEFLLALRAGG